LQIIKVKFINKAITEEGFKYQFDVVFHA